jgi:SpoVK/Ycf46/Vps4 family AAA+-type ATPase
VDKAYYRNSIQHVLAELERVDVLIRAQVMRARQIQKVDNEFQGLFISEAEVDALLDQPLGLPRWAAAKVPLSPDELQAVLGRIAAHIAACKTQSEQHGITLRLDELARLFALSSFEIDALLICFAPEIDLRYERLYAYLQDDVTKKKPGVDLVLNLLSSSLETKLAARHYFTENALLRKFHLVHILDDPSHQQSPLLSKYVKVDDRIVSYLHGSDDLDPALRSYAGRVRPRVRLDDLVLPADMKHRLMRIGRVNGTLAPKTVFYFQGAYGVGKQTIAEALCGERGLALLTVKLDHLMRPDGSNLVKALPLIYREARLQTAAIYWSGFDALLAEDNLPFMHLFMREMENRTGVTFLAGEATWEPMDALYDAAFTRIKFPHHSYSERLELWRRRLNIKDAIDGDVDLPAVANKFRFTGGQIRDAANTARNLASWRDPETARVTMKDLYAACRLQSNRKLDTLAQKIEPNYCWDDIVLPGDRLQQLHEVCNYVKHRARVYNEWGFSRKLSLGKGVNTLFAGPSGTGKTMAAEIVAGELALDLYKIDLSTVVSKYIGETEKNLARIFAEAETSNAILFFDEADALFGKRSEIRDAHDRYANIEISYLLQKMEEYEGVVVLSSNLRKNMDEAFVRRMHFTVEFPFPSAQDRLRIWERIWPDETPRSGELDLTFMAQRFDISGGNIRNVALAASFLAADDGQLVTMAHLIHAIRREYQKMGKVITEREFGKYAKRQHTR